MTYEVEYGIADVYDTPGEYATPCCREHMSTDA